MTPHPPDPTDLPLEREALLLSGQDSWSTPAIEEAGLPSVTDERTVTLSRDDVVPELTLQSSVAEWSEHPVAGPQLLEGFLATMPAGAPEVHEGMLQMIGSMPMRRFAADLGAAIPVAELERLMAAAEAAR